MRYFSRNQIQDENMAEYIKQKLIMDLFKARKKLKEALTLLPLGVISIKFLLTISPLNLTLRS